MQTVRKRATWESATCSGDERPLARVRLWTFGCAAVCLVLGSAAPPVAAGVLFGTLSNFDVLNDTGEEARGFEIELDGVTSQDIGGTFDANRYGPPKIVPFSGGVYVHYMSTWDPASQQFSAGTPVATNFTPTTGHQCISAYPAYQTSGCDHFGVWLSATQATNVSYRWMVAAPQTPGALIAAGTPVSIPAPTWTVIPQAAGGPAVAAEIHPPPPPRPEKQFGEAQWVKIHKTEVDRNVDLDELVTGNPVVPEDPDLVELEWKLLQHNPHSANSNTLKNQGQSGGGSHAVVRRYEFYKYTGAVDPDSHEALCGGDGSCSAPLDGELGDYIGAQMAAANLGEPAVATPTATRTVTPVTVTTPTRTPHDLSAATATSTATANPSANPTPTATAAPSACAGDCNRDGTVTVDEILTGVNIALGGMQHDACLSIDADGSGSVSVDELLQAINNVLAGCQ